MTWDLETRATKSGKAHKQLKDGFSMLKYAPTFMRVTAINAAQATNWLPSLTRAAAAPHNPATPATAPQDLSWGKRAKEKDWHGGARCT